MPPNHPIVTSLVAVCKMRPVGVVGDGRTATDLEQVREPVGSSVLPGRLAWLG